jgi:hypothetical protein
MTAGLRHTAGLDETLRRRQPPLVTFYGIENLPGAARLPWNQPPGQRLPT